MFGRIKNSDVTYKKRKIILSCNDNATLHDQIIYLGIIFYEIIIFIKKGETKEERDKE